MSLRLRIAESLQVRTRYWAWVWQRRRIAARLAKLDLAEASAIRTWTHAEELEALFQLAADGPADAEIVELGSFLGASTCYLAAGSARRGARLTCIDTWQNETMPDGERDTFAEFQRHTAAVAARIRIVRRSTRELLPGDLPARIDLGFIDADHSYEATQADAALLAPLVAPDGILAFHDTTTFAGVSRAVAELLAAGAWCLHGQTRSLVSLRRAAWAPWPLPRI